MGACIAVVGRLGRCARTLNSTLEVDVPVSLRLRPALQSSKGNVTVPDFPGPSPGPGPPSCSKTLRLRVHKGAAAETPTGFHSLPPLPRELHWHGRRNP